MRSREPVERKVKAASAGAYLAGVGLLGVVEAVREAPLLLSGWPDWAEALVLALVPAAVTFLGGWTARHTPRGPGGGDVERLARRGR